MNRTPEERIERERELERLAIDIHKEDVANTAKRDGLSATAGGKSLIKRGQNAELVAGLEDWLEAETKKRRRTPAYQFLKVLPPAQLAYLVSRSAINALAKKQVSYRGFIENLASEVLMACGAELYRQKDSDKFAALARKLNWEPRTFVRMRRAVEEFREEFIEVKANEKERLGIGATLTHLFCQATGLFEVKTFWQNAQSSTKRLIITEKGEKWLTEADSISTSANPYHLPMVIKPYPWTDLSDGGYLLRSLHPAQFIRTKERVLPEAIREADLSVPMAAVNAIQETPWRINKFILDVWRQCVGQGLAGCSDSELVPVPPALPKDHEGFDTRRAQRREAFEARKDNAAKRCVEKQKARMADILEDEPELYFPHNLDFRGRIYPLAGRGAINPQGDDSGKAMLEFAEGKPLGEDGVQWLFIHTQNCLGNDKVSLQSRIDATEQYLSTYAGYAQDPMKDTAWMRADKPFCFLACCKELLGYLIEGDSYVSRLPIALDGSCSGLQHFAGLMADQTTAEAVNVAQVTTDRPADVYQRVADHVRDVLATAQARHPLAGYWVDLVTRDLVKQPVMTLSYGVTEIGMRDQIKDKCRKLVRKGKLEYQEGTQNEAAAYMAARIKDAISVVASAAFDVMEWLAKAAAVTAEYDHESINGALRWVTPVGLPVIQEYYVYETSRLSVFVDGREMKFTHRSAPVGIKKTKQKQGSAPNFVHSMDASHLMLTVLSCRDYGIGSFAMIHDSFGTHAADTGAMFELLRQAFTEMYQEDWLLRLYQGLPDEVQEKLDPPPSRGTLDLSLVQESEFFFA